tara:strand:+ start:297 stop:1322 length:1026 start_codon:yes stop_codon:yes gene_type:complete
MAVGSLLKPLAKAGSKKVAQKVGKEVVEETVDQTIKNTIETGVGRKIIDPNDLKNADNVKLAEFYDEALEGINKSNETDSLNRMGSGHQLEGASPKVSAPPQETPIDPRTEPIKNKSGKETRIYSQESKDYLTGDVIRSQSNMSPEEFAEVGYPSSAAEAVRKKVRLYKDPKTGEIMTWKFKKIKRPGKSQGLWELSPEPNEKKKLTRKKAGKGKRDIQEKQQTIGKRGTSITPEVDEHIHHKNQLGRIDKLIEEGEPHQQRAWLKFIAKKIGYPTGAGEGNLIAIKKAIHNAYHAAEKGIPIPAVKGGSKPTETLTVLREYLSTQKNLDEILENLMRTNK